MIGNGVLMLAMPLYILDLTGKGSMMGIFGMLSLLPALLVLPFAGVLGDKLNRKYIMVFMDILNGLLLLSIFVVTRMGLSNIYFLALFSILLASFSAVFSASTNAMLPDLVGEEVLGKATSLKALTQSVAMIIGPLLGGALYGFFGIEIIFLVDGISFLLSALSESFIYYEHEVKEKMGQKIEFFKEIKEGILFSLKHKNLKMLLFFALISNFLMSPIFSVVYPYVIKKELGYSAQAFGLFETFFVVGMLLGNLVYVGFFSKKDRKVLMKTGLIVETMLLFVAGIQFMPMTLSLFGGPNLGFLISLMVMVSIFGFANIYVNVPIETNMQIMVPKELRSRVFSTMGVISQGGVPIGTLIVGFCLDYFKGYQINFTVVSLCIIASIWFLIKAPDGLYRGELS